MLIAPAVVTFSFGEDENAGVRAVVAVTAIAVIAGAVYASKRRTIELGDDTGDREEPAADPAVVT